MLRGLDKRISAKTKLPVHIAEDPLRAVARGTSIALKNIDKFQFLIRDQQKVVVKKTTTFFIFDMRNLFAFFRRFRVFLVFILMQIFALTSYFSFLQYPRAQYLTTASAVAGKTLAMRNDLTKHFNLGKSNSALQRENKWLREQLPQSFQRLQYGLVKINDTLF